MPFRKSYTLVGVLDSGKSEGKVEVMTELAEKEVADAWMRGGGGGGGNFLFCKKRKRVGGGVIGNTFF